MKEFINVNMFYISFPIDSISKYVAASGIGKTLNGVCIRFYAFTPRKDIAKHFMEMRNHEIFIHKKVKMGLSEYNEFVASQSDFQLMDYSYNGYICDNGKYKKSTIYILCTGNEYSEVKWHDERSEN